MAEGEGDPRVAARDLRVEPSLLALNLDGAEGGQDTGSTQRMVFELDTAPPSSLT